MPLEDAIQQLKAVDWILLERVGSMPLANDVPAPKLKLLNLVEDVYLPSPVQDRKVKRLRITDLGKSALLTRNPNFVFPV